MTRRLYIGNLPWSVTDSRLREIFSSCGQVRDAKVVTDKETGQSRGFGFVEFESEQIASEAMALWNGNNLDGRNLVVNEATERSNQNRPRQNYNPPRNDSPAWSPPENTGNAGNNSGRGNWRDKKDRRNRDFDD